MLGVNLLEQFIFFLRLRLLETFEKVFIIKQFNILRIACFCKKTDDIVDLGSLLKFELNAVLELLDSALKLIKWVDAFGKLSHGWVS